MFRFVTLVVCLLAGCTLGAQPPVPDAPPGPEDLSTWGTPEMVLDMPPRRKLLPQLAGDHKPTPAEKVYPFVPGGTYTVPVGVGAPLDIQFQPGESVHQAVDSDRRLLKEGEEASGGEPTCQRWCLKQGKSGVGETQRGHVFVMVTEAGLKNGLTITTTRGVYAVTLESVKVSPIRFLRWTHDPDPLEVVGLEATTPGPLPRLDVPSKYRVGYQAKVTHGRTPDWMPRQIVDDGKKIYVLFPESVLFGMVPMLRVIGPNGPMPVNGRQYLNVLIIDQLFARAEIRLGTDETAEVVTIDRGTLRIVECPAEGELCPRWPTAAYRLQGGGV